MPFVEQFRTMRFRKAKRAKALLGRPGWQDELPKTAEAKETFRIAAKYQRPFSAAVLKAIRDMMTPEIEKEFKKAYRTGSIQSVLDTLPFFNEGETDDEKVWTKFIDSVSGIYSDIVEESGRTATQRMNKEFGTDMKFTMEPLEKAKAKTPKMKITFEPINPYSIIWVQEHALDLAKKTLSKNQREVVSDILFNTFSRGVRAEKAYDEIKANIGLNLRGPLSYRAVANRQALHYTQGLPPAEIKRLSDKYRDKLLATRAEMIARTETIKANAAGRNQAWKLAQESGELPEVEREWITAPDSPNPQRPCSQCESLNGERAPIGEPYTSNKGEVDMPPAHPDCRCTEALVKADAPQKVSKPEPEPDYDEQHSKWIDGLNDNERDVFDTWGSEGSPFIQEIDMMSTRERKRLTDFEMKEALAEWKILDKALNRAPVYKGELYRGLSYIPRKSALQRFAPGATFEMESLTSWSKSPKVRGKFANGGKVNQYLVSPRFWEEMTPDKAGDVDTVGVFLRTKVDKGKAIDIQDAIEEVFAEEEAEVLLRKGKKFQIEEIRFSEDESQLIVDVKEIA